VNARIVKAVAASIVVAGMGVFPSPTWAAPVIMSPEPVFDFGERDSEEKVEHNFVVKNAGDEVLNITDVKTTCGCTVAKPAVNTLAPGEETTVGVTFNLKNRQGVQNRKITVLTNDPETPQYYLELKGTVTALIMMEPTMLNFGRIEDNEPHTLPITIRTTKEGYTFELREVTIEGAAPIQTVIETVTPGKEYKVVATTNPNLVPGSITGTVTIATSEPDRPTLQAKVFGHVIGALTVQPNSIRIQSNSDPNAARSSQFLQVIPGRAKEFELLEIIPPIEGMKAELIKRKDNDYHIKLSEMPVDKSLEGKELIVRTNLPDTPEIRIPFQVRAGRPVQVGRPPARVPNGIAPVAPKVQAEAAPVPAPAAPATPAAK
jgi:hypothetical protein